MTHLYEIPDLAALTLKEYRKLVKTLVHDDLLGSYTAYVSLYDGTQKLCYFKRMMAAEDEILRRMRKGDK